MTADEHASITRAYREGLASWTARGVPVANPYAGDALDLAERSRSRAWRLGRRAGVSPMFHGAADAA